MEPGTGRPERDVHETDEHGHLNQRPDHAREGLPASCAERADRNRDRKLEVVRQTIESSTMNIQCEY